MPRPPAHHLVVCAALILAFAAPAATALPSHFIYAGERLELEILSDRLVVLYAEDVSEARKFANAAEAGIPVLEVTSTGQGRWHDLRMTGPLATLEDVDAAVEALLRSPEVEFVSPVFRDDRGFERVMMRDILVGFDPDFQGEPRELLATRAPEVVIVERRIGAMPEAYRLRGPYRNGFRVLEVANRLSEEPGIDWAEPDMIVAGIEDLIPNDPFFISLWGLRNTGGLFGGTRDMDMGAELAWEITTGTLDAGAVMIMDSGVQPDHPDLNLIPGDDFTGEGGGGAPVLAGDNHGTLVAGCASAIINNAIGVVGVSPDVPAVSARVCGSLGCVPSGVADALEWALDQGYRVTNWSYTVGESNVIRNAYRATNRGGIIHFSSAGNTGTAVLGFPQNLVWVHGIAALNNDGELANFSNYGPGLGYAAPGVGITTTDRTGADGSSGDDYYTSNGTSFAAPYAAGVAALAVSMDPDRGAEVIENLLNRTSMDLGTPGWDESFGWGFVSANGAVRFPTRRISLRTNGLEADDWSGQPSISETGRRIAFATDATNLGGDNNGVRDVMAHNRETGRTRRISLSTGGAEADSMSEHPSISAEGRYVAFETDATNLVTGDTNGLRDVLVRDRDVNGDGTYDENGDVSTERVSVSTGGAEATGGASWGPSISGDGDRIAFTSEATNLVGGDGNVVSDVFLREVGATTTTRASVTHLGSEADGPSRSAALSADGLHVAFESDAVNLVPSDGNGATDVFVRDLAAGTTVRVSVATGGGQASGASTAPAISENGRFVAFASDAPDLVTDGNGVSDVFVHDRDPDGNGTYDEGNGTTTRVSVKTDGTELTGASGSPSISNDGMEIAFETLPFTPSGSANAVYVHSRTHTVTFLVSKSSLDDPGTGRAPRMSGDGRMIAYDSDASSLVPFDGNAAQDVFLFQDNPCEPPVIILQPVPKTVNPGDPFTLKTNATGSAPSYQWIKDGFEIPGEIGRWYGVAAAEVTDSGIYRVVASNHCGSETSTSVLVQVGATGVEIVQSAPSAIALDSPAPSPFVERAAIRFGLPERSHVRLTIHDVAGRVVATLANGPREAGWHEIPWSGRDDGGTAVASGVYFVRLESAVGARTAKVVKLR